MFITFAFGVTIQCLTTVAVGRARASGGIARDPAVELIVGRIVKELSILPRPIFPRRWPKILIHS